MVTVDASVDLAEITIGGRDVSKILSGGASTGLAIILGFRQTGESELKSNSITNSPKQLADCVQILTNFHIPVQLTQTAANAVKGHVAYLRSWYNDAVNRGLEIQHDLPARTTPSTVLPAGAEALSIGSGPSPYRNPVRCKLFRSRKREDNTRPRCIRHPEIVGSRRQAPGHLSAGRLRPVGRGISGMFRSDVLERPGCSARPTRETISSIVRTTTSSFLPSYQMMANERDQFASLLRSFPVLMVLDESHHIQERIGGLVRRGNLAIQSCT